MFTSDQDRLTKVAQWLFSFRGRLNRSDYWKRIGAAWAIWLAFWAVVVAFAPRIDDRLILVPFCASLALLFIGLVSAMARRLHDMDQSAWWTIFYLVFSGFGILILGIWPGVSTENRFGPAPPPPRDEFD